MCHPVRAEGLRWQQLGEKEAPNSGTGPIHQERMMRSRFRGPCGSAVKAAPHPESGASFSPSCCSAALCSSRVTQTPVVVWGSSGIRIGHQQAEGGPIPGEEPLAGENCLLKLYLLKPNETAERVLRKCRSVHGPSPARWRHSSRRFPQRYEG